MYDYQKYSRYFAQIAEGIKEPGAQELAELGASEVSPDYAGIYFPADKAALYRINYSSRLCSRILAPIASFQCRSADQLYREARQIRWTDFFTEHNTFAVFSNVSDSSINNSHFASLRLKDAIADSFRKTSGARPSVQTKAPDIWLNLYIRHDRAVISLDTSGGSLHRRGYRQDSLSAPMQETVAAAIIRYTQWDGSVPLFDPMCGSGTILSEALMQYCRIPSGLLRSGFGFERLPDYDRQLWQEIKKACDSRMRELPPCHISGSDISAEAVRIARRNMGRLPHGEKVTMNTADFQKTQGLRNGVIITNPPYGIRMGEKTKLDAFYKSLGDFLKQKCTGSAAFIYFGDREFIKKLGLKATWKRPLQSGGLDGRLVKYELF